LAGLSLLLWMRAVTLNGNPARRGDGLTLMSVSVKVRLTLGALGVASSGFGVDVASSVILPGGSVAVPSWTESLPPSQPRSKKRSRRTQANQHPVKGAKLRRVDGWSLCCWGSTEMEERVSRPVTALA
jgi:hypothetical protein